MNDLSGQESMRGQPTTLEKLISAPPQENHTINIASEDD
jgi:hypothetical protein